MAKARKHVRVRVRTSFNGLRRGDESMAVLDNRLQGWLDAGLVEVIGDGEDSAGQGGAEPDAGAGVAGGAAGGFASGGGEGEGFGAGAYGAAEGFDQG